MLIDRGADVNSKDTEGSTPLHEAASAGNSRRIVPATQSKHLTFLFLWPGADESVKILIDHGADLNSKDYTGATPLHKADLYGKSKSIVPEGQTKNC